MKKSLYILAIFLLTICTIFLIRMESGITSMEKALEQVEHWEVVGDTIYMYTYDGNYYSLVR